MTTSAKLMTVKELLRMPDDGFRLTSDPDTVRCPDVAFVRQERIDATGGGRLKGFRGATPDLAIEIISPNDTYGEADDKIEEWLAAGCRMVVGVNPRRDTVTVFRSLGDWTLLTRNDTLDGGDVVSGWRLPLSELFGNN